MSHHQEGARRRRVLTAGAVPAVAAAYLAAAWLAFLLVDVANVAGSRDVLERTMNAPHVWVHLFREGAFTELFQWLLLGSAAMACAFVTGILHLRGDRGAARFWLLLGVAATLMLIEDAGNPRHRLADYGVSVFGLPRTVSELAFFSVVAAVPLYAVATGWRHPWKVPRCRTYLLAGMSAYAVAVTASGTRVVGDWYDRAGTFLAEAVLGGNLLPYTFLNVGPGFWLMDWLLEESVELVGASMLCAAVVAYAQHVLAPDGTGRPDLAGARQTVYRG